jgi:hypothetical protein
LVKTRVRLCLRARERDPPVAPGRPPAGARWPQGAPQAHRRASVGGRRAGRIAPPNVPPKAGAWWPSVLIGLASLVRWCCSC